MGIRATITHVCIVLYRERAFGADDDVNSQKPARVQKPSLLGDRLQLKYSITGKPVWTRDSQRIAFMSDRPDGSGLYWTAADGAGQPERLASLPDRFLAPTSWSRDGNTMLLSEVLNNNTGFDIGALSMDGDRESKHLLQGEFIEAGAVTSAYMSTESDGSEIYVRPFPDVEAGKWRVSTEGGTDTGWSPDGRGLLYRAGPAMMSVVWMGPNGRTRSGWVRGVGRGNCRHRLQP